MGCGPFAPSLRHSSIGPRFSLFCSFADVGAILFLLLFPDDNGWFIHSALPFCSSCRAPVSGAVDAMRALVCVIVAYLQYPIFNLKRSKVLLLELIDSFSKIYRDDHLWLHVAMLSSSQASLIKRTRETYAIFVCGVRWAFVLHRALDRGSVNPFGIVDKVPCSQVHHRGSQSHSMS
jgi:hypothetical protein